MFNEDNSFLFSHDKKEAGFLSGSFFMQII